MRISVFCGLCVHVDGVDVTDELPGRQGRALVAYLALAHPRPVSRGELLDVLWPSRPPAAPDAALSSVLAKVRRVLGPALTTGRDVLGLRLDAADEVDAQDVATHVDDAERALGVGDHAAAFDAAQGAAAVLCQPLLPGVQGEWVDGWRRHFAELEPRALEAAARAGIELAGPRLEPALAAAAKLVEDHRFREGGYALLMEAQVRRGDVAEALRTFERVRVLLRDELGASPSPHLVELHDRLLREGSVAPAPAAALPTAQPAPLFIPTPTAVDGAFVGRAASLDRLRARWQEVRAGQTRLMLLVGESGVGKTRLATQFAEEVHADGGMVLYGRADEEALLPHQPFVEALRSLLRHGDTLTTEAARQHGILSRLLPDLAPPAAGPPPTAPIDTDTLRYRLFEAVAGLLTDAARRRPVLLILDDLHWADKPTLLLLRHLLRHPELSHLLVVGTFRHVEVGRNHPLVDVLTDLRRERRYDRVTLDGLDEADTRALVVDRLGEEVTPGFVRRLRAQTEGNAFFIEETVRALLEGGAAPADAVTERALERLGVPEGVAEVIHRRVRRLSPTAAEILTAAAVVGRDFDLGVVEPLVEASGEDMICAVEESLAAGLILEHPERIDAFAFSHALVREVLYRELSTIRRVRLHQRVAETLEALTATRTVNPAELAHHFRLARQLTGPAPARRYAIAAAEQATELLAYEEAAAHYRRALTVFEDDESGRCEVLLALGRVQWHAGDDEARHTFLTAADSAARRGAAEQLARAALGLGERYWEAVYVGPRYRRLLEEAVSAIGPADGRLRALLLTRLAVNLAFATEHDRATALSAEALGMARRLGDEDVLVAALLARHVTQLDVRHLDERLAIAEELASVRGIHRELSAEVHQWRLYDLVEAGELDAARHEQTQLDALAQQLRQPLFHSIAVGWRGIWAELAGDVELAERCADECLRHGQRAHTQDALSTWAAKLLMLRRREGRLAELAPMVERLARGAARGSGWRAAFGMLQAETGHLEEARTIYEQELARGPEALPRGIFWLTSVVLLSEVGALLGDEDGARTLYRALEPHASRNVVVGYCSCWGPVDGTLTLLAATSGDRALAARHLRRALARTRAMEAPLLTADLEARHAGLQVETA